MANYKVTFEGETFGSDDDKYVEFTKTTSEGVTIPKDFMPKMFEYLESDYPYDVLYQIKTIDLDSQSLDPDTFISIVAQYNDDTKGGLLLEDDDEKEMLVLRGSWNFKDLNKVMNDIYSKPDSFKLVVVTIAEDLAPE